MYVFLAVAPCSFAIGGKTLKLSAGSTFTISKELGEQLRANTFPYRKHLRLMSQLEESASEVQPQKEEITTTNTVKQEVVETVADVKLTYDTEESGSVKNKRTAKKTEV